MLATLPAANTKVTPDVESRMTQSPCRFGSSAAKSDHNDMRYEAVWPDKWIGRFPGERQYRTGCSYITSEWVASSNAPKAVQHRSAATGPAEASIRTTLNEPLTCANHLHRPLCLQMVRRGSTGAITIEMLCEPRTGRVRQCLPVRTPAR
jgi:hypothetical protein